MNSRMKLTVLALAALTLCSACAEKSTSSNLVAVPSQQYSALQWDEAVSARTAAHVTNNNLIIMR